ncbi:zinc-ribbon domain-containing protein [Bacteroidota bacterium]
MAETPVKLLEKGGHPMSFDDKSIQCSDCRTTFTFSAGEQEFFQTKGFTNEPKRCPDCRRANKARRSDSGSNSYASRY